MKRKKSLINNLKNNRPKIEPCRTPTIHTNNYIIPITIRRTLFFVYDLIGSYVSNLNHFYQYHRLQIVQQEDHEVESN